MPIYYRILKLKLKQKNVNEKSHAIIYFNNVI